MILLCDYHKMILEDFLVFILHHLYQLSASVYQLWRHIEDAFFTWFLLLLKIIINLTHCNSGNLETRLEIHGNYRWENSKLSNIQEILDNQFLFSSPLIEFSRYPKTGVLWSMKVGGEPSWFPALMTSI